MSDVNTDKIPVPAQPEVLLHCLMDIAEALLAVGAEVTGWRTLLPVWARPTGLFG